MSNVLAKRGNVRAPHPLAANLYQPTPGELGLLLCDHDRAKTSTNQQPWPRKYRLQLQRWAAFDAMHENTGEQD